MLCSIIYLLCDKDNIRKFLADFTINISDIFKKYKINTKYRWYFLKFLVNLQRN